MEGEQSLRQYSPELVVQDPNVRGAVSLLPSIILFHGAADYSIPWDARFESLSMICCWNENILDMYIHLFYSAGWKCRWSSTKIRWTNSRQCGTLTTHNKIESLLLLSKNNLWLLHLLVECLLLISLSTVYQFPFIRVTFLCSKITYRTYYITLSEQYCLQIKL